MFPTKCLYFRTYFCINNKAWQRSYFLVTGCCCPFHVQFQVLLLMCWIVGSLLPVLYTIASTQYRTLSQILYLDDTYLHRIYCFIRYIFTSNFGHHTTTFLWSPSFHFISRNTKWQGRKKRRNVTFQPIHVMA